MTLEQWSYVADIIGVILVIASLVYVAQQLRQNTDAIQANSRHTIITTDMQGLASGIAYPAIEHSMYKKKLTEDEKVQLEWWLIGLCRTREHQWFQYKNGSLDQKTWKSYLSGLRRNLTFVRTNAWWKSVSSIYFDKDFVDEVNRYLEDVPIIEDWVHPFDRTDSGAQAIPMR